MKIEGPLTLGITDDEIQNKRTLEINFKPEFQQLKSSEQVSELKTYIQALYQNAQAIDEDHADRTGLLLVMQVCEQLLPHIQEQQLDLNETIELEMSLGGIKPEISVSLSDLDLH